MFCFYGGPDYRLLAGNRDEFHTKIGGSPHRTGHRGRDVEQFTVEKNILPAGFQPPEKAVQFGVEQQVRSDLVERDDVAQLLGDRDRLCDAGHVQGNDKPIPRGFRACAYPRVSLRHQAASSCCGAGKLGPLPVQYNLPPSIRPGSDAWLALTAPWRRPESWREARRENRRCCRARKTSFCPASGRTPRWAKRCAVIGSRPCSPASSKKGTGRRCGCGSWARTLLRFATAPGASVWSTNIARIVGLRCGLAVTRTAACAASTTAGNSRSMAVASSRSTNLYRSATRSTSRPIRRSSSAASSGPIWARPNIPRRCPNSPGPRRRPATAMSRK